MHEQGGLEKPNSVDTSGIASADIIDWIFMIYQSADNLFKLFIRKSSIPVCRDSVKESNGVIARYSLVRVNAFTGTIG